MSDYKRKNSLSRTIAMVGFLLLLVPAFTTACGDSESDEENNAVTNNDTTNNDTTNQDELGIEPPAGATFDNSGSDIVDNVDGEWAYDMGHSRVGWESAYSGKSAMIGGQFNEHKVDIFFDQADLGSSWVNAEVTLSSITTGDPARDYLGSCVSGSLGIDFSENAEGEYELGDANTNVATFTSDTIEKKGDGYVAHGELEFRGNTSDVELKFGYIPATLVESPRGDKMLAGFSGEFTFQALTHHGVETSNINDTVTVMIDANLYDEIEE